MSDTLNAPDLKPNRLYSARDVTALLGVHVTTLYAWMNAGKFPRPRRIGPRTVRWTGSQIIDHLRGSNPTGSIPLPGDLPW